MKRVTSNLKTSEMVRKGITPETVNALGTLWRSRFEELTARAQEQGACTRNVGDFAAVSSFAPVATGVEGDPSMPVADVTHDRMWGGAAASPNTSAADWFDGENYDQTDGFGDELGDLARNVRAKHDAGACAACDAHPLRSALHLRHWRRRCSTFRPRVP
jgi:hypothetical protein